MKIKTSKISHFFFYFYHLSRWHFSSVKELCDIWTVHDSLTSDEIIALKKINGILKKYDFGEKFLGNAYIEAPNSKLTETVYKMLPKLEAEKFFNSVKILTPRFNSLFEKDQARLKLIKRMLGNAMKDYRFIEAKKCIMDVFGCTNFDFTIRLFVLPESYGHMSGSANTKGNFITLELRNSNDIQDGILILFHEVIHKIVRKNKWSFKVTDQINSNIRNNIKMFDYMTKEEAAEELFVSLFFPNGFIAKQFYNGIELDSNIRKLPEYIKKDMEELLIGNKKINKETLNHFKKLLTKRRA